MADHSNNFELAVFRGGRDLTLKAVSISDAELAAALASDNPEQAAREIAEFGFDAANAGVKAELEYREAHLIARRKADEVAEQRFLALRNSFVGLRRKQRRKPNPEYTKTFVENSSAFLGFSLARFALIAVTIAVIVIYLRASSYSVDLSTNIWMAIAFSFPVLIASVSLSGLGDLSDSDETKKTVARIYGFSGFLVFGLWLGATAVLFGLETQSSHGLSFSLTNPQAVPSDAPAILPELQRWVEALFPTETTTGRILLFTHVLADVLLSASAGLLAKISARAGREVDYMVREDYSTAREALAALRVDREFLDRQIEYIAGIRVGFEAGRNAAANSAVARVRAMLLRTQADQLVAKWQAIERIQQSR